MYIKSENMSAAIQITFRLLLNVDIHKFNFIMQGAPLQSSQAPHYPTHIKLLQPQPVCSHHHVII